MIGSPLFKVWNAWQYKQNIWILQFKIWNARTCIIGRVLYLGVKGLTLSPPLTTTVPYANILDLDETLSNSASHPGQSCLTLRQHFHQLRATLKHWELKQMRNLANDNEFDWLRVNSKSVNNKIWGIPKGLVSGKICTAVLCISILSYCVPTHNVSCIKSACEDLRVPAFRTY